MLAYALYAAFVGVFIALAALGHLLLLSAIYPNLFGAVHTWQSDSESNERSPQRTPTIAA